MAECAECQGALFVTLEPASDDEIEQGSSAAEAETVPDDVWLKQCGHHFHWDCLLSAYTATACPACSTDLVVTADGSERILVDLNNEGGVQHDKDILPLLTEESYLKAYPEERRARAFIEFCRQGDLEGVVSLLQDDLEDDDTMNDDTAPIDVLRYQDTLQENESALQAAVSSGSQEIAWLILFLASNVPEGHFPPALLDQAKVMGFARMDMDVKTDVRSLRDAQGHSAADTALTSNNPQLWHDWINSGRLSL